MNFFESQEQARRKTLLLLALFVLAILATLLLVNLACYLLVAVANHAPHLQQQQPLSFQRWLASPPSHIVNLTLLAVIIFGMLRQWLELRQGGQQVARMAGGIAVPMDTSDPAQKQLINIVEEMALAAGIQVPDIYLLPNEAGINAFVAGHEVNEATLAVTSGLLEQLSRAEVQGVIAHEFSHILNGDMKINLHLVAVLGGLMLLGDAGRFLMRSARHTNSLRGASTTFLAGSVLSIIGYAGLLTGRMVKAAIVRQREYLADASAVQFTRDTSGIGGALYKIAKNRQQAFLQHSMYAETLNHLCFGESVRIRWQSLMASHPPIERRIQAIDRSLLARLRSRDYKAALENTQTAVTSTSPQEAPVHDRTATTSQFADIGSTTSERFVRSHVGRFQPADLAYSQRLLHDIPMNIREYAHQPDQAAWLVKAICLLQQGQALTQQEDHASIGIPEAGLEPRVPKQLLDQLARLGCGYHFPLIELALPVLKRLPDQNRRGLLEDIRQIVQGTGNTGLSEYALLALLNVHLHPKAGHSVRIKHHKLDAVTHEVEILIAILCRFNANTPEGQRALYERIITPFSPAAQWPKIEQNTAKAFHLAIKRLRLTTPFLKAQVLAACVECIMSDGKIQTVEYELLRVIADILDCPMPALT